MGGLPWTETNNVIFACLLYRLVKCSPRGHCSWSISLDKNVLYQVFVQVTKDALSTTT